MKRLLVALLFLGFVSVLQAKTIEPVVYLKSIKMVQSSEQFGDELYFNITEFPSQGKGKQYTIPELPLVWPAEALSNIANLKLWSDKLSDKGGITLVIELMERDAPPYDVDESIGSTQIKLSEEKGHLMLKWGELNGISLLPVTEAPGKVDRLQKLTFKGAGGVYEVEFVVSIDKSTVKSGHPATKHTVRSQISKPLTKK